MGTSKAGDWTTITWARYMQDEREVLVHAQTDVAAGTVNELTPSAVRVGNKRILRKHILKIRPLQKRTTPPG